MDRLTDFTLELKRRRVLRALIGWGIISFAVLQVAEPVMHGLDLPDWTPKVILWCLVAGFPITVVLAWAFDLTAKGVKRTGPMEGPGGTEVSVLPIDDAADVGMDEGTPVVEDCQPRRTRFTAPFTSWSWT